jgi:prevent-host-death family protein
MVITLRESKAKLSHLVDMASRGEEVLITVRGKVKARLTKAGDAVGVEGRRRWVRELREMQASIAGPSSGPTIEQILAEDREDRV